MQLDEVAVAILCDPAGTSGESGESAIPDRLIDLYVDAINDAVKNRPGG